MLPAESHRTTPSERPAADAALRAAEGVLDLVGDHSVEERFRAAACLIGFVDRVGLGEEVQR